MIEAKQVEEGKLRETSEQWRLLSMKSGSENEAMRLSN